MTTIDVDVNYCKDKWYNSGKSNEYYDKFQSIIMFGFTIDELKKLSVSDNNIKNDVIKFNADSIFYCFD